MRAIVIEGAKGASEYQLWDQMVQEKCPGLQHYLGLRWGVCPVSGNGGILTCLDLLLRLAKHDYTYDGLDTDILVCYDTTVNSKIKEDFLSAYGQWYNDRFKNTNNTDKELSCVGLQGTIRIHLVRYYCFEDCLLLSTILLDWVYSKERQQDASKPSWYGKTIDQMTDAEVREYIEYFTGGDVGDPNNTRVDSEAAKNLDLQG